jgi:hypothetical protein
VSERVPNAVSETLEKLCSEAIDAETPGKWLRRGVDLDAWRSDVHLRPVLFADRFLLRHGSDWPEDILATIRREVDGVTAGRTGLDMEKAAADLLERASRPPA